MPVLATTLQKFHESDVIDRIILIVPVGDIRYSEEEIVKKYSFHKVDKIIAGGKRRQDSVRMGIEASEGQNEIVLIHDGVRPFIESGLIEKAVKAMQQDRAVVVAMPANDTVKEVNQDRQIIKTLNRKRIWLVQTPQVFRYEDIKEAHQKALDEDWGDVTDDAMMIERIGIQVKVIPGSEKNIKNFCKVNFQVDFPMTKATGSTGKDIFCKMGRRG